MKIMIIGCGKVGTSLVRELSLEGHEVTVIDNRADRAKGIVGEYDVMGLVGSGMDHSLLQEGGIDQTDLFIAVTGNDELNLLCCLLARKLCENIQTIARVRSPEYSETIMDLQSDLGVSVIINPELAAAREVFKAISLPPTVSAETFSSDASEIYKLKIPKGSVLEGMAIKDIPHKLKSDILICMVERKDDLFIPDGEFILHEKDLISITGQPKKRMQFFKKIGIKSNNVHNVMVIGAGKLAFYLAKMLEKTNINLTLVDNNRATCEKMATFFPNATIIEGNGSDRELLADEGLENMDAFVSLTGIDEENIILSLYIRSIMPIKTITKINRISFDDVINALDLDTIINPKKLTSETIIRYVRAAEGGMGSNVETVHRLAQDRAEALEFYIREKSRATNIPLMNLKTRSDTLAALIVRDGKAILPRGTDEIRVGDSVIFITTHTGLCTLDDVLDEDVL